MPGYSTTPLAQKLGLKAGLRMRLVDAPGDFEANLGDLPVGCDVSRGEDRPVEIVLIFADRLALLRAHFAREVGGLPSAGAIWIAWPKKASKVPTDLSETLVRELGLNIGLVDVKVCAITDVWSGLRFVRRLKDR